MSSQIRDKQRLIEAINDLPPEALGELANFVDYLQYKSTQPPKTKDTDFLIAIAGLGTSSETDISERDEEILRTEIDPIRGWSTRSGDSV